MVAVISIKRAFFIFVSQNAIISNLICNEIKGVGAKNT